jgi:hypothetical protein
VLCPGLGGAYPAHGRPLVGRARRLVEASSPLVAQSFGCPPGLTVKAAHQAMEVGGDCSRRLGAGGVPTPLVAGGEDVP